MEYFERTAAMYTLLSIVIACWHHALAQRITDIRLAEGRSKYSGRVEIFVENRGWGTVCDDYWDIKDALVVCRQLGFGPALAAYTRASFGAGSGPIHLDDVECEGNEDSLSDCESSRNTNMCSHGEDAGVKCVNPSPTIRLEGGQDNSEGRVEIFVNDEWGTVCHNGWDIDDATVVCRQFGFNSATEAPRSARFGEGTGPVLMTNTQCIGYEENLSNCNHDSQNRCPHSKDASVICTGKVNIEGIRLSDGDTIFEGRVEVMIDGQWGTVCDDDWGVADGHVVCRALGYLAAIEVPGTDVFGEGEGEVLLNNFHCNGNEASLADCRHHGGVGGHGCGHFEDAAVRCLAETTYSDIRLTGGRRRLEGRVEIFLNGQWGTICDDHWDINAANVLCREMGYPAAESNSVGARFGEGSGPIWWESVRCHGNEPSLASCSHGDISEHDCTHFEDVAVICEDAETYTDIRLAGGTKISEGRVEISVGGQWGTICDDSWDLNDADVVCRELGYTAADQDSAVSVTFGRGSGPIWFDGVGCNGNESSLALCSHNGIGNTDCNHNQDVGVKCHELSPSSIEGIRLAGGNDDLEGRVEVLLEGEWGTICDDEWDIYDADIVCRELGFDSAAAATANAYFGQGTGRIWLDDVQCAGNESSISNCTIDDVGYHNCEHDDDAGVICVPKSPPTSIEKMRLSGGSSLVEGRVEIRVQGEWGTICDDKWDIDDALVVCKQLGFESALEAPTGSFFGSGRGPIWLDNVECEGEEDTILQCKSDELGAHDCSNDEAASVVCLTEIGDEKIVLNGGDSPGEGILEVNINGEWEALCNDEKWDKENADVVCRQLGFNSADTVEDDISSVLKSAKTWKHYFQCSGEERHLDDCPIGQYSNVNSCESQLVTVKCLNYETAGTNSMVYIGAILFLITILVVLLVVGLVIYRRSRKGTVYFPGSRQNEYVFPYSPQRPLPNAPLNNGLQEYVKMNGKNSNMDMKASCAEKSDSACGGIDICESNTYSQSLQQTYDFAASTSEQEDPYSTTIFDSNVFESVGDDYQPIPFDKL